MEQPFGIVFYHNRLAGPAYLTDDALVRVDFPTEVVPVDSTAVTAVKALSVRIEPRDEPVLGTDKAAGATNDHQQ